MKYSIRSTDYGNKKRREYLGKIAELLKDRKLLAILGIRRSGKSTLIYQSIKYLLVNGTELVKCTVIY